MIQRLQGKVENIAFIKNIGPNLDLCSITIGFDELKIFYDSNDLMPFINQDVIYTIRPDVIDGKQENVICELALLSTIQTVKSTENIKLVPEGVKRTVCNFSIRSIKMGEFRPNSVAYLCDFEEQSSPKAKWFQCIMIDQESKQFEIRMFQSKNAFGNTEALLESFKNHYVAFDLESTKYGYQTQEINVLPNDVELSPEVEVAKQVVLDTIQKDPALAKYNSANNFMSILESYVDGEPGYQLVRIASEIYMINAVDNISTDLNIQSMKRAAICSRGYCLPHKKAWSRPMLNTNKAMQIVELRDDRELMSILDALTEEEISVTKQTYINVRQFVDRIICIRRGVLDENIKANEHFADMRNAFGGLL